MAGKMDQRTIIVLAVVGSLGVLSAILGFSGELTHICETGVGLGVCAVIFLIIAQVIIAVVGGCCGCYKSRAIPSETNQIFAVVCAVASWIATLIAFALLVMGANLSAWCPSDGAPNGIFAGGALLALAATALGLSSYILLRRQPGATAPKTEGGEQLPAGGAGIAMGQPQFPQQSPPQGYGQAPPPSYPQHSPPPQGPYGQAPNGQFPTPPPAQGYGAHAPNQQFPPPPPAQGYGAHAPNQQFSPPPPPQGYGAPAPNQQYVPPAQGYGAHAPNQQFPPLAQGYGAYAPNQQFPPPAFPPSDQGYGQAPPPKGDEQV